MATILTAGITKRCTDDPEDSTPYDSIEPEISKKQLYSFLKHHLS